VVRISSLVAGLALTQLAGCVPKAPKRANSAESRAGIPYSGAEQASVESLLAPRPAGSAPARAPRAGRIPSAGYWHWDGVRYVRIGETTEDENPAYLWPYRDK
jgi:hypothetical protein